MIRKIHLLSRETIFNAQDMLFGIIAGVLIDKPLQIFILGITYLALQVWQELRK